MVLGETPMRGWCPEDPEGEEVILRPAGGYGEVVAFDCEHVAGGHHRVEMDPAAFEAWMEGSL